MAVAISYMNNTFAHDTDIRTSEPVLSFQEARHLAMEFGTPLLVLSRTALARNYETLAAELPGVELFYAAKSNPNHDLLKTLCELGSSVDVCSYKELQAALNAGFTPDRILHTHPCKTPSNLLSCRQEGLEWFIFDNELEAAKMVELTPDVKALLRVAVASSSSVIDLSAKFGVCSTQAVSLLRNAVRQGLDVRGLAFHVGSQCLSPADFEAALNRIRAIWDEAAACGIELEVLDIGGGLPTPYRQSVLSLETYCRSLRAALENSFGDISPRIIAEPGRVLSGDAVTLVTKVLGKSVRPNGNTQYIIDDGLYGSFSGKVFDHTDFPIIAEDHDVRETYPCIVAGPTCDSTDVVAIDQPMPELEVGELLLVPSMGAYTSASAAAEFNGLPIAGYVAIH